jgi:hypothetical protein
LKTLFEKEDIKVVFALGLKKHCWA